MRNFFTKIFWNIEVGAVQKHVNLVDLVTSFPTKIFLQNLASIQKRTSPIKFAHLAQKSEQLRPALRTLELLSLTARVKTSVTGLVPGYVPKIVRLWDAATGGGAAPPLPSLEALAAKLGDGGTLRATLRAPAWIRRRMN